MCLLHKVDLQLFLQLRHKLLKLLAARVCSLLHELLQLRGGEAWEGGALQELVHLLQAGGQQGQLQRGRGGQLPGVRVAKSQLKLQKKMKKKLLSSTVVVPAVANNEIHCSLFGYFDNFQFNLDLNCFRDLAVLCKIIPRLTSRSPCLPGRESWLRTPLHCGAA